MLESQLWEVVPGTLFAFTVGGSVEVRLSDTGTKVTVRLAGIAPPKKHVARTAFEQFIRDRVGKDSVSILMPHRWTFSSIKPRNVTATITMKGGADLGLLLIENKHAHFREPPPYTMSRNLACRYRLSDQAATHDTIEQSSGR
jgi:endonuclease YncB( thermonuclease family)